MSARRETWEARYRDAAGAEPQAAPVLREYSYLLPSHGAALDVACGLGGNALLLAERGLRVTAWDISTRAIAALRAAGERRGLELQAQVRDVEARPPPPASFDVIVVTRFLARPLCAYLRDALRPDGVLFYQTFVRAKVSQTGPDNLAYLLDDNELLSLFTGLRVLVYRDEGIQGDARQGVRNEAWLVAQQRD
ncbi:MAG: class I SAM-dependent methyltransferase [Gammaproteobacteria bacterium]|nr:class I SAM-dependent methyltransferase [Gammaproteobacteria bacterium]